MTSASKRTTFRKAAAIGITFVAVQFIRPELSHPPATAELPTPLAVNDILRASCYPCHSNEARFSWFDRIVPAYQLVVYDIKQARRHLNFSELGAQPVVTQHTAMFEALNHIQMGAMPPLRYTSLHPEAVITPAQLAILKSYLVSLESGISAPKATVEPALLREGGEHTAVQTAPNGIAFLPDYRNWKSISSTERRDNNTLRQILGNEVAIKAISERSINPWPDGAILAKVVWHQKADPSSAIGTGEFVHVAFMIKDKAKYAATAGWGWAQWNGTELVPFGNGRNFANDCVACHAPLHANDYVFTMPIPSLKDQR